MTAYSPPLPGRKRQTRDPHPWSPETPSFGTPGRSPHVAAPARKPPPAPSNLAKPTRKQQETPGKREAVVLHEIPVWTPILPPPPPGMQSSRVTREPSGGPSTEAQQQRAPKPHTRDPGLQGSLQKRRRARSASPNPGDNSNPIQPRNVNWELAREERDRGGRRAEDRPRNPVLPAFSELPNSAPDWDLRQKRETRQQRLGKARNKERIRRRDNEDNENLSKYLPLYVESLFDEVADGPDDNFSPPSWLIRAINEVSTSPHCQRCPQ
jgi:hypothetical protein